MWMNGAEQVALNDVMYGTDEISRLIPTVRQNVSRGDTPVTFHFRPHFDMFMYAPKETQCHLDFVRVLRILHGQRHTKVYRSSRTYIRPQLRPYIHPNHTLSKSNRRSRVNREELYTVAQSTNPGWPSWFGDNSSAWNVIGRFAATDRLNRPLLCLHSICIAGRRSAEDIRGNIV